MKATILKEALIGVIKQIQKISGLECPTLDGRVKPVGDVPKFDSKVWPVATTLLATELRTEISNDVNIFVDSTSKQPRSIDEAVEFLSQLLKKQAQLAGDNE